MGLSVANEAKSKLLKVSFEFALKISKAVQRDEQQFRTKAWRAFLAVAVTAFEPKKWASHELENLPVQQLRDALEIIFCGTSSTVLPCFDHQMMRLGLVKLPC